MTITIGKLNPNYYNQKKSFSIYDNGVIATIDNNGIQSKYVSIYKNSDGFKWKIKIRKQVDCGFSFDGLGIYIRISLNNYKYGKI